MIIPATFIEKYDIENAVVCNPAYIPKVYTILRERRKNVVDTLLSKVIPFINNNYPPAELKYSVNSFSIEDSLFASDLISFHDDRKDRDIKYMLDNSLNIYNRGMFIFKINDSDEKLAHSYYINEYKLCDLLDSDNLVGNHITSIFVESSGLNIDNGEDISFVYEVLEAELMTELSKYMPLTRIYKYFNKSYFWLNNPKSAAVIDLEFVEPSTIVFISSYYANLFAGIVDILDVDFDTVYNTLINKEWLGFHLSIIFKRQMELIWNEVTSAGTMNINVIESCYKLYEDFCLRRYE